MVVKKLPKPIMILEDQMEMKHRDNDKTTSSSSTHNKEEQVAQPVIDDDLVLVTNSDSVDSDYISSTIYLGAGCYWGTQKYINESFQKICCPNSISTTTVGFMSPDPDTDNDADLNPSYANVCSGSATGPYIEVLKVELKPEVATAETLKELLRFFFRFHDPTQFERQGYDIGPQYSSYIFATSDAQRAIAEEVLNDLQGLIRLGRVRSYLKTTLCTKICEANSFYPAHEAHQKYLDKNSDGYCNHYMRFHVWPE